MFAEQEWDDGREGPDRDLWGSRGAPDGRGRPGPVPGRGKVTGARPPQGPTAARRKRRRPGADGETPRGRPGERPDTGTSGRGAAPAAGPGPAHRAGERPNEEPAKAARRLSRRQRLKRRREEQEQEQQQQQQLPADPAAPAAAPLGRAAALRARMEERLLAARFRYINQQLYTSSSREAAQLFRDDPEAFQIYHRGFTQQVSRWPENPVQRIASALRRRSSSLVVADFGCGDCKLAKSIKNKVHSFDLVPLSPEVTVCDMAKVPLADASVDVAVFCLALMGTNLQEILEEANRVLKLGGTLMVAEVASRFEDMRAFMSAMAQLGFKSISKDLSSAFFYLLEFSKTGSPRGRPTPGLRLRPCLYKRR
ncbi:ribosomal RNA-processing protein 8 [Melopsittacus undulatus]|uniref:ribosomal RNA-processing protein 8 n=1 Tax=Melopsittacus undulatus TaxID=13146 RepID=UPI00146C628C|nr:ribosomal RNA-processing protein 8 [Melopsittacus undulatus]